MTDPLRVVVLGPIPATVREALRSLPGGAIVLDHPAPVEAVDALGIGDASLLVLATVDPPGETIRALVTREVARARRYGHPLGYALLRVDGREQLERTVGREALAAYLADLEDTLRRSLRRVDVLVRTGPGTFAVLLPETAGPGARAAAERLRDLSVRLLGKPGPETKTPSLPFRATVSIGLVWLPDPAFEDGAAFLQAAEKAAEEAGKSGGNRVAAGNDSRS